MAAFPVVAVIYNPKSTGNAKRLAEGLRERLAEAAPDQNVEFLETEHAGHAEELAYEAAKANLGALVMSSSGDGGYHEVVNGLMRAATDGYPAVAGLLPAGNANDHFNNVHDGDLIAAIAAGKTRRIDLLKLQSSVKGQPFERYAHSYIGLGITPKAGQELNKVRLTAIKEAFIVARAILFLEPVEIKAEGRKQALDSLVFSNIGRMSKVARLSDDARPDDGKFEVSRMPRTNKWRLIGALIAIITVGQRDVTEATSYDFESYKQVLVQLDGEISQLDANSRSKVTLERTALECVV